MTRSFLGFRRAVAPAVGLDLNRNRAVRLGAVGLGLIGLVLVGMPGPAAAAVRPIPRQSAVATHLLTSRGSMNPVTAAPPPTRPATPSCTVTLARSYPSNAADGSPQKYSGTLAPPAACGTGGWSKVLLDQTITVSGRQYDRVGDLLLGSTEIYWGTTEEPSGAAPITYHVSTDITRFAPLLHSAQKYTGGITNYTSSVYTGVYVQTVTVTYFRTGPGVPAAATPDVVVGAPALTATASNPLVHVPLTGLPRNITRAVLEITLEGSGCDEQWFDDVTYPVTGKFPDAQLCGNGPYREADIGLDNQPAGSVQTFPHIYSGGIVPTLWRPIPAIGTFSLFPESLDLTPFAGQLVDGKSHDLSIYLDNAGDSWSIVPTLLLWTDHGAARTSGALTTDDVNPIASELQRTDSQTASAITTTVTSSRHDTTAGYLDTSAGRITTTVVRTSAYFNHQTLTDSGLTQQVTQSANGDQAVTTVRAGHSTTATHLWNYPLSVNSSAANYVDDQNFDLTGHVTMSRQITDRATGMPTRTSAQYVDSYGELARANGVNTVSSGRATSGFDGPDDRGVHYHSLLAARDGVLILDIVVRTLSR